MGGAWRGVKGLQVHAKVRASYERCVAVPACGFVWVAQCVARPAVRTAPRAALQFERPGTHGRRHRRRGAESSRYILARLSGEENSPCCASGRDEVVGDANS